MSREGWTTGRKGWAISGRGCVKEIEKVRLRLYNEQESF